MAKKELINNLPSDPQERKRLMGTINEMVESMVRAQDEKDAQKDICDLEKEKYSYDPKMIKFYAKMEFDRLYKAEKARAQLELQSEQAIELDILMGRA